MTIAQISRAAGEPLMAFRAIQKSYGPIVVLKGVDLILRPGEVHGLLGENGAGKSTLMRIVFGLAQPDRGTIELAGKGAVRIESPRHALSLGIGLVSQELSLVPQLDVAQNIFLGSTQALQVIPRPELKRKAAEILAELAPHIDCSASVGSLGMADRQLVEIARTLARGGEIIAFDEPTSSLTPTEQENLFKVIAKLRAAGKGIVYISHRMSEIRAICDVITVLRDGQVIMTDRTDAHDTDTINTMITGRELSNATSRARHASRAVGPDLLSLDRLTTDRVKSISASVKAGEIFGLAGLVGSGRSALLRAIFGIDPIRSGHLKVAGREVTIKSPSDAIAQGVAYLPEDRRGQAVVPMMSIESNFGLVSLSRYSRFGFIDFARRRAAIRKLAADLSIKPRNIAVPLGHLSGGNQQKVIIARWLATNAKIYLFDEPTRGIDVGAKAEIYELLQRLAAEGAAVVVVSSELPELLYLADRIGIMEDGHLSTVIENSETLTEDRVMKLMTAGVAQ